MSAPKSRRIKWKESHSGRKVADVTYNKGTELGVKRIMVSRSRDIVFTVTVARPSKAKIEDVPHLVHCSFYST